MFDCLQHPPPPPAVLPSFVVPKKEYPSPEDGVVYYSLPSFELYCDTTVEEP